MPKEKPIPVRLEKPELLLLKKLKAKTPIPVSELIRRAVRLFLDQVALRGLDAVLADTAPTEGLTAETAFHRSSVSVKTARVYVSDDREISLSIFETSAGHPLSPADSPVGTMKVSKKYDVPGAFVLQVNGDSMDAADLPARLGGGSILPGDRVVMQWAEEREPRHKDIVAVQIFGNGSTLKEYREAAGVKWLEPRSHNPEHQPIKLENGDGAALAKVQAVMIGKVPAKVSRMTPASEF